MMTPEALAQKFYQSMAFVAPDFEIDSSTLQERWPPWKFVPEKIRGQMEAACRHLLRDAEASIPFRLLEAAQVHRKSR